MGSPNSVIKRLYTVKLRIIAMGTVNFWGSKVGVLFEGGVYSRGCLFQILPWKGEKIQIFMLEKIIFK